MRHQLLPPIARFFVYPLITISITVGAYITYTITVDTKTRMQEQTTLKTSYDVQLPTIKALALNQEKLLLLTSQIDPDLPQPSTTKLNILNSTFQKALIEKDFTRAEYLLSKAYDAATLILENQDTIAKDEVVRLRDVLKSNISSIDLNLGDTAVVPVNATDQLLDESVDSMDRLSYARTWVQASADELKRRRSVMDEAQKQIVMIKSQNVLQLYENGSIVYSMPISLGRRGWETRSGDFSILDKLGTVWSYWEIWLPYWMGIYFAGSSENGIHGLPFDDYGNVYWTEQVGKQDITYGCVMPDDPDMIKLYEWGEVGVPVAIVD